MKTISVFLLQPRLFNLVRMTICRSVSSYHCFSLLLSVLHIIWTKYRMLSKQDVEKSRMYWVWFSKEDIKGNTEQKILALFGKFFRSRAHCWMGKYWTPPFFHFSQEKRASSLRSRVILVLCFLIGQSSNSHLILPKSFHMYFLEDYKADSFLSVKCCKRISAELLHFLWQRIVGCECFGRPIMHLTLAQVTAVQVRNAPESIFSSMWHLYSGCSY